MSFKFPNRHYIGIGGFENHNPCWFTSEDGLKLGSTLEAAINLARTFYEAKENQDVKSAEQES